MMKVRAVSVTKPIAEGMELWTPEDIMVYCARVSSPQNQENLNTGAKLLKYCIDHKHWSVFDMVELTVEIETSRAISAQILRHKSFCFQEFSQRYAEALTIEKYEPRRQDYKNRQNSTDDLPSDIVVWWDQAQKKVSDLTLALYQEALGNGIAKECARFLLPMATTTKLYMKGSVRSWIHYMQVRRAKSTQKEHRDIADAIWEIFKVQFPVTADALLLKGC